MNDNYSCSVCRQYHGPVSETMACLKGALKTAERDRDKFSGDLGAAIARNGALFSENQKLRKENAELRARVPDVAAE